MYVVVVTFILTVPWLSFWPVELSVGGESGINMVAAPAKASSLTSLVMVCDGSTLFSSAPCTTDLAFDLLHVI